MDLKKVFSSVSGGFLKKEARVESFLAVKISATNVTAAVWTVRDVKVEIGVVGMGKIERADFGELLKATDKAVSMALGGGQEVTDKVVFALPYHFVSEGKVIPEKLRDLRRLCKELDLQPVGFVSLIEALENFYKETEGAPLTAILIGVDGENGILSMYRAGKNLGNVPIAMNEGNIGEGMEEAFKRFMEAEVLPSRIILYDGKSDLEAAAKKITAYPWTQKAAFLHFPKVEVMPSEMVVKAVAVAGGREQGGKYEMQNDELSMKNEKEEVVEAKPIENLETLEGEAKAGGEEELQEVSAEEAGFVLSGMEQTMRVGGTEEAELGGLREIVREEVDRVEPKVVKNTLKEMQMKIQQVITGFRNKVRAERPVERAGNGRKLPPVAGILLMVLVLAVAIIGGASVYLLPKAMVIVALSPKSFDHQMEVTVITGGSQASGSAVLPGDFVEVTEIGTKKGVASGSKLVGEKAKGSVTIYGVSGAKTFPSGTAITSPEGLKFTLDQDAAVASGDAITPATTTVAVTAADIGSNYNLAGSSRFGVGKYSASEYLAKSSSNFSGGSSHQATVVTKDDQNRLLATLSAELSGRALGDLAAKVGSGQSLLPNAVTQTVTKKRFSKDVDSEADTVSLDLTVDFRGVVFSKEEMLRLFATQYAGDIPAGYILSTDKAQAEVKTAKTDKAGNMILTARVAGDLLPTIDGENIMTQIRGQSWRTAEKKIRELPGVSGVSLEVKPRILETVVEKWLPWKKENLSLVTVAD